MTSFKKFRNNFLCLDCGKDTFRNEYYMLRNPVWKKANPKIKGMLCIKCVEKRLGRKLTKKDFADVPLNRAKSFMNIPRSALLKNRLGL